MACNCKPRIYGQPPQPKVEDCLCINDLRVGCPDGPAPCGDTIVIDLTETNDVTASPCDVVYILKDYDKEAFASVELTSEGILTVVTSDKYVKQEEFCITYKVDSPCSLLSDQANVYICMKDLCKGNMCENECDPCTGDCIPLDPEVSINKFNNTEIGIS